jgi:hypothetical protein
MRKGIFFVVAFAAILCLAPMAVMAQTQVIKIATQSPLSGRARALR